MACSAQRLRARHRARRRPAHGTGSAPSPSSSSSPRPPALQSPLPSPPLHLLLGLHRAPAPAFSPVSPASLFLFTVPAIHRQPSSPSLSSSVTVTSSPFSSAAVAALSSSHLLAPVATPFPVSSSSLRLHRLPLPSHLLRLHRAPPALSHRHRHPPSLFPLRRRDPDTITLPVTDPTSSSPSSASVVGDRHKPLLPALPLPTTVATFLPSIVTALFVAATVFRRRLPSPFLFPVPPQSASRNGLPPSPRSSPLQPCSGAVSCRCRSPPPLPAPR